MVQEASRYFDEVNSVREAVQQEKISTAEELEQFRIKYLGSKGVLKSLFGYMKDVPVEEKKNFGQVLNTLKQEAEGKYATLKEVLDGAAQQSGEAGPDLTRPGNPMEVGARHPVYLVRNKIIDIFSRIGYTVSDGPEIEDDWHNFTALNFPPDHPARDMQDTYFIQRDPDMVLRTHTSSVQVRVMENTKPPIRTISPGRVYRNETISSRSHCFFHQIEGLYIDENVSFADLKQTLYYFAREMFGPETKIRLRPSYFPFTEPSAEMDIYWGLETETDRRITKGTGWLEILGCGMVDPAVLDGCGIDSKKYTGFAFGIGVDRITMNQYQIGDIRLLSENDVRFLKQFRSVI